LIAYKSKVGKENSRGQRAKAYGELFNICEEGLGLLFANHSCILQRLLEVLQGKTLEIETGILKDTKKDEELARDALWQ
jgi:hypothetical protein